MISRIGKTTVIKIEGRQCIFRSRLESLWARRFHRLGLPWIYEPERFRLEPQFIRGRAWYTPDFKIWFPRTKRCTYIEVKPTNEIAQQERAVDILFHVHSMMGLDYEHEPVYLAVGEPRPKARNLTMVTCMGATDGDPGHSFRRCSVCGTVRIIKIPFTCYDH